MGGRGKESRNGKAGTYEEERTEKKKLRKRRNEKNRTSQIIKR